MPLFICGIFRLVAFVAFHPVVTAPNSERQTPNSELYPALGTFPAFRLKNRSPVPFKSS
jgi:hypothetical protein